MKKTLAALFALSMIALAGCNTVAGAGEDVSASGHAVTNAAEKAK
jgi:predicted small secreted protein